MPAKKISELTEDTTPALNDYVVSVDVSDTTMAASGTNKKVLISNLLNLDVDVGGLSDAYATITDGTTPATASGASAFKLRSASNLLTVTTTNNDPGHGDNALFTVNQGSFNLSLMGGLISTIQ